jgi:cbb3-type cytochrome oxidase subunit 3
MLLFEHCMMMSSYVIVVYVNLWFLACTWFAFGLPSKTGYDNNKGLG